MTKKSSSFFGYYICIINFYIYIYVWNSDIWKKITLLSYRVDHHIRGSLWLLISWWQKEPRLGVMFHRCIAMHWYFVTTICIDTADPLYRDSHETICITILEKDQSKHIFFLTRLKEIIWYRLGKVGQSHVSVQPAAVVVVGTPSTGVAGCVRYFWSQVSLFSCYSRRPSGILLCLDTYQDTYCIATSVSRYVLYRETPVSLHP